MNTQTASNPSDRQVWNKGKLVGQKSPLRLSEIWAIRVRLEIYERVRDLALFNLAIDSKLRGCDLVQLRLRDVANGGRVSARAIVMQHIGFCRMRSNPGMLGWERLIPAQSATLENSEKSVSGCARSSASLPMRRMVAFDPSKAGHAGKPCPVGLPVHANWTMVSASRCAS
jgi:hypothetical protein